MSLAAEPAGCTLRDASAADGAVFLICENGVLVKSRDAVKWEAIHTPSGFRPRAIQFVDRDRGFLAGDSGSVVSTHDGGTTWNRFETGEREDFTSIRVVGASVWVAGYNGTILHSGDAGRTWQRQPTFTTQMIESIYFADPARGWAVGWSGLVLRTVDGGTTWQQVNVPGVWMTLSTVYFKDPQNGWVGGMNGVLLHSRDGGITWERQPVPVRSWLSSMSFAPDGTGWIAAEYDLLRSTDGGESWTAIPVETLMAVTRVVATRRAVVAMTPGSVLTGPGDESAWRKREVAELIGSFAGENSADVR
jgi:photosystem II stability/assembly factor-like uncharacterized protein